MVTDEANASGGKSCMQLFSKNAIKVHTRDNPPGDDVIYSFDPKNNELVVQNGDRDYIINKIKVRRTREPWGEDLQVLDIMVNHHGQKDKILRSSIVYDLQDTNHEVLGQNPAIGIFTFTDGSTAVISFFRKTEVRISWLSF